MRSASLASKSTHVALTSLERPFADVIRFGRMGT